MWKFWRKNGLVIAGATIQGFGMGVFLFPHAIPSGGAGGMSVLLNYWFHVPIGFALWLVNFSMLLLAMKYLGNRSTLWTMLSITVTSLSIFAFQQTIHVPARNVWIDLAIGSIFLGTGVGILLREGVSNGGVGVIALIIANSRNILPGKPLFLINGCIFILTASVIKWEIIIQALLSQWISTIIVDLICKINFYQSYTLGWRKK
ncbi:YitT family protein [Peribacillus saganii]|uniref:YitT family protein n=1 Tax=Peribacillus saganii TaxID=2303992 RepID=A0A372LTJ6_9BACI|nr:YitT family protein [Peribacillus saganii]RFU71217.1 YitT family protein [Peribacillus saganii]